MATVSPAQVLQVPGRLRYRAVSSDPEIQPGEVRLKVEPYEPLVPPGIDDEYEAAYPLPHDGAYDDAGY